MTRDPDRRRDEDAFRPRGEATREPDHVLEQDEEPHDQLASTDYPESGEPSSTCLDCGRSVPPTSERCASCRHEYGASKTTNQGEEEAEMELLHLVFAVVTARTETAALAKGMAAHSLLVKKGDPAIHECELIAENDGSPSRTLTERWGDLPDVVPVEGDAGERLLQQVCDRTQWRDEKRMGRHATCLYDHAGKPITSRQQLNVIREQSEDALWLVPGLALQQHSRSGEESQQSFATPTQQSLTCRRCERETPHRFRGAETGPERQWAGQPIWECEVCDSPRHGPNPS